MWQAGINLGSTRSVAIHVCIWSLICVIAGRPGSASAEGRPGTKISVARWKFRPMVSILAKLVTKREQGIHILGIEWLLQFSCKCLGDAGEIEIDLITLGRNVDAVNISELPASG